MNTKKSLKRRVNLDSDFYTVYEYFNPSYDLGHKRFFNVFKDGKDFGSEYGSLCRDSTITIDLVQYDVVGFEAWREIK